MWRQAQGEQEGDSWKELLNPVSHSPAGACCLPESRGAEGGWREGFFPTYADSFLWAPRAPSMDEETEAREASGSLVGSETLVLTQPALRLSADS